MSDPADECAVAWEAYAAAGPRVRHDPPLLARALLHAARAGLCRTALSARDDADDRALATARASCLLQLALRAGGYDPHAPGERAVWAALLRVVPPGWAEALDGATPAAKWRRDGGRAAADVLSFGRSVSGVTDTRRRTANSRQRGALARGKGSAG